MQMKKETIALKHTKRLIALLLGLCLLLGLTACTSSAPRFMAAAAKEKWNLVVHDC